MAKILRFRAAPCLLGLLLLGAAPSLRERLTSFYTAWFARIPGTHFTVAEAPGVRIPGLKAYLVSRAADPAAPPRLSRDESAVALHDPATGEVFAGEVLHDSQRAAAGRAFDPAADLPNVRASLEEGFGVPVRIEQRGPARGALLPLEVMTRLEGETFASRPGFVSSDGASLLIGEFHSLGEKPEAWRKKHLSETPGVRVEGGSFFVTEFLDFQCERCRRRTPEARAAARQAGGALDVHFLPLVKSHEWAFAAAESAAALAALGAAPYSRYEEMVFARSEGLSASGARQLAADVAESAGEKERFEAELSSGRARARVVRDVELAGRIGVGGTPAFVVDGRLVPGDRGFLERELALRSTK
ncbi:MAG TPA: thioredoxin domain-containing protein [Thermoanaerobaculia bacterium]|nr:thioredoxin domain-containing protein [Thermoanaerobaculia bacterium]